MVARNFYVTLQQVIRSVLIIIFPIAFITLFAWATAGSTYGTTSDPMRAAVWLWLGTHLTPFNILSNGVNGYLSYLPIGAVIFPWLAIKNGFNRANETLANRKTSRAYFILNYVLLYTILALVSINAQVKIDWIRGLPILLIILIMATSTKKIENLIKLPFSMFLVLLGVSGMIFTLSLAVNFDTAKNLTIVIQPGILGGILLVLLQVLYLPNLFFATLSYLIGVGFSLGRETYISPFVFELSEIPAIPVLAALPTGEYSWLALFTFCLLALGMVNINLINKVRLDTRSARQLKIRFIVISIIFIAIVSWLSSGSLLSENMSPVGVNPLIMSASISVQLLLALLIVYIFPRLFKKKVKQGRLEV